MVIEWQLNNVGREFSRIQDHFPDIRGQEGFATEPFQCLESQLAHFVKQDWVHFDDEILQMLSLVGLRAYERWSDASPRPWTRIPKPIQEMAFNLTKCFDPAANPEIFEVTQQAWTERDEAKAHFLLWGAVIRRLIHSVRLHQKRDPRGYCRYVVSFVSRWSNGDDDRIHWAVLSRNALVHSDALLE